MRCYIHRSLVLRFNRSRILLNLLSNECMNGCMIMIKGAKAEYRRF